MGRRGSPSPGRESPGRCGRSSPRAVESRSHLCRRHDARLPRRALPERRCGRDVDTGFGARCRSMFISNVAIDPSNSARIAVSTRGNIYWGGNGVLPQRRWGDDVVSARRGIARSCGRIRELRSPASGRPVCIDVNRSLSRGPFDRAPGGESDGRRVLPRALRPLLRHGRCRRDRGAECRRVRGVGCDPAQRSGSRRRRHRGRRRRAGSSASDSRRCRRTSTRPTRASARRSSRTRSGCSRSWRSDFACPTPIRGARRIRFRSTARGNRNRDGAPNHRYTTDYSKLDAMLKLGWVYRGRGVDEGVRMCAF
jgi:hypothetical protein